MFVISDGCGIVDLIIFFMREVNDRNERERCSDVIIDYNCPKIQVRLVWPWHCRNVLFSMFFVVSTHIEAIYSYGHCRLLPASRDSLRFISV